jgi:hypothetical protein
VSDDQPSTNELTTRILAYLVRRAATPENLAHDLAAGSAEIQGALDEMTRRGWVSAGAAWYGNDPSSAITIMFLTREGRQETERRQPPAKSDEPVELSREELVAELKRSLGWTDHQIAMNPSLRASRFYFWPSITAWQMIAER